MKLKPIPTKEVAEGGEGKPLDVKVVKGGVSYVVPGAPFEYMYSYTETPKVRPLALREPPITPFGPQTMPRPWTGRKPLPPSKKKLPEFDSFTAPPSKKGMKPVQRPGPFLPGSGPKNVWSRVEILGEPLTIEEVTELIEGCRKSSRQLNMGRDGLTHNMLNNIHAHWKRRRVCKIKCKGVCTVDMDNVSQQLEEKTGGKIIYRRGGVIFLFRGRNYNYRTRPQYPLMLWKPITPVYPRLVKRVPDGLTLEEAMEMRRKGRELIPLCKLAKNGVYVDLVTDIREAFEACELVRIDCQGLNPSDYKKIGGKLKDLVPCVLISFENEHILVWRGREWKSTFDGNASSNSASTISDAIDFLSSEDEEASDKEASDEEASDEEVLNQEKSAENAKSSIVMKCGENIGIAGKEGSSKEENVESSLVDNKEDISNESSTIATVSGCMFEDTQEVSSTDGETLDQNSGSADLEPPYMQEVLLLLRQAVESGNAIVFDEDVLDSDLVYERSVSLAQVALPGPVFRHRPKRISVKKSEDKDTEEEQVQEAVPVVGKKPNERTRGKTTKSRKMKGFHGNYGSVLPQGSLGVDELAKLLG